MCCSTIFIYTCIVETNQHTTKYYYIVLSIIALFAFENGRSCYKHIIIERHGFRCGHIPNLSRNQINHKFADFQNQKVKHARNEVNYIPLVSYYILNPTKNLNQNKPLSYCVLRAEYISIFFVGSAFQHRLDFSIIGISSDLFVIYILKHWCARAYVLLSKVSMKSVCAVSRK
ncbi:Hypothetical_protein [Hexamita inflata]|uniref:Hypothetical_protein n=1 Tax=Hexamita inflata TaxID=28002 RepID=A0ABP1H8L4_9EUKA